MLQSKVKRACYNMLAPAGIFFPLSFKLNLLETTALSSAIKYVFARYVFTTEQSLGFVLTNEEKKLKMKMTHQSEKPFFGIPKTHVNVSSNNKQTSDSFTLRVNFSY